MALLEVKTRRKYFKKLGFGEYNYDSILKMQKKYFRRAKDHDGIYGPDSDALLRHLWNCRHAKSFKPEEFRCPCGKCTGYPTRMKVKELKHIQSIRDHYKRPMTVTSGLRCKAYNNSLSNSTKDSSPHIHGYAVDFYMPGVTDTVENRQKAISYIKTLKYHHYTYGNAVKDSNGTLIHSPKMGNALHTDAR